MSKLVLLDTMVLGLATNPRPSMNGPVLGWIRRLLSQGHCALVPEIADFELRRELLRIQSIRAVRHLDSLGSSLGYVSLDTATIRRAAELWAQTRKRGRPLAHPHALDGDVILCAQAELIAKAYPQHDVIVATTNVAHIRPLVPADDWQYI